MKDTRVHCFIFQSTVPIYIDIDKWTTNNKESICRSMFIYLWHPLYYVSQRDELEFCCVVFA